MLRIGAAGALLLLTLSVALALSLHASQSRSVATDRLERADDVGLHGGQALKLVLDLETGQRGYLITGDARFLAPWREARRSLAGALASFEEVSRPVGVGADARRFRRQALSYLHDYSEPLIELARSDIAASRSTVRTGKGLRRVNGLRTLAAKATTTARASAESAKRSAERTTRRSTLATTFGFGLSMALVAGFLAYLSVAVLRPIRRTTAAAGALQRGELSTRVKSPQTRELGALAESFNAMAASLERNRAELDARHQELDVARREAERANASKNEFLSRMSHELRTPLNAILGFGQILELDGHRPSETRQILKAGRHLLELINEVLDISRIESGDMKVSLEPVCAAELLRESVDMIGPLASSADVRLACDFDSCGDLHVRADRQRLKQALLNLLANAVKYNRPGGRVNISCARNGSKALEIVVADTGIGIAEHDLERLFMPFERLVEQDQTIEGTGLGLALTKRLVEAMDGRVSVTSEVGKGSIFVVSLAIVEAPSASREAAHEPSMPSVERSRADKTVLYVEDNASILKLVEAVLARRPEVTLLTAMHGSLALDLAFEHRPALILLDLGLPDIDGLEVLRRLRADPRTVDTPVVVVSAEATDAQIRRVLALGATRYLPKPFDIDDLLLVVDESVPASSPTLGAPDTDSDASLDGAFLEGLIEMRDASPEQAERVNALLRLFSEDAHANLTRLRDAEQRGDLGTVADVAHALIGGSGSVGAFALAEVCRTLEEAARRGEPIDALIERVAAELAEVEAALERIFGAGRVVPRG